MTNRQVKYKAGLKGWFLAEKICGLPPDSKLLASQRASKPFGPILRYSDTSLLLSIMLI